MERLRMKIVERGESLQCRRQGGRDLRVVCVGPVLFTVDDVAADLCAKRFFQQGGGARKFDRSLSFSHSRHLEAMGLQPGGHRLDVRVRGAKLTTELFWGQPLVE